MVLTAAMWVHGSMVEAEYAVESVTRKGWGTHFFGRPLTNNWFHIPIPTPVIFDEIRPQLVKVFVFYRATYTMITDVHIYDGSRQVKVFDGLNVSGDHSVDIDSSNSWDITPPLDITFGLGVSVGVAFLLHDPDSSGLPEILFTTAGADFGSVPQLL
jgi:hypothetical protein